MMELYAKTMNLKIHETSNLSISKKRFLLIGRKEQNGYSLYLINELIITISTTTILNNNKIKANMDIACY